MNQNAKISKYSTTLKFTKKYKCPKISKFAKSPKCRFYKKRMTELAKNLETYYDRIQEKLRNTSF